MHHTKNFSEYSMQKKTRLIILLAIKFVIVIAVIVGLKSFLETFTASPIIVFGIPHLLLLAGVIGYFFIHKRLAHATLVHDSECTCK